MDTLHRENKAVVRLVELLEVDEDILEAEMLLRDMRLSDTSLIENN